MPRASVCTVVITVCAMLCFAVAAEAQETVMFFAVGLDKETKQADEKLREYLRQNAEVRFEQQQLEYGKVIKELAEWDPKRRGVVMARTTPYVQVAAEMLGAELEILATYESRATEGETTYRSYYVVRKNDVKDFLPNPTPENVITLISDAPKRIRFTYHSLFSTSSFFLPSLHFRENRVFHMPKSVGPLAIKASRAPPGDGSSDLVRSVARGDADLAAVWDGTRAKFEDAEPGSAEAKVAQAVEFVPLPSPLPNDLLVCSRSAPEAFKESVRSAIRAMDTKEIDVGDFLRWVEFDRATAARKALAELRDLAREQVRHVTVKVQGRGSRSGTEIMTDAARHAVRLSGTELRLYKKDFHAQIDTVWTLDEIHDGAARLTTEISGTDIPKQVFPISFRDPEDLMRRIVAIVQDELHRIRYVWPYSGHQPIVIRDNTLPMPRSAKVPVQRITWADPKRNDFLAGSVFPVGVRASSPFVHELVAEDFPDGTLADFNPMSNVSYRVYQLRVVPENVWFRVATGALVVLLILAAIAAIFAVRRQQRKEAGVLDTVDR